MRAGIFKTHCLFAGCHNDVVKTVELACKHNVCLIPFGGEYGEGLFIVVSSHVRLVFSSSYKI